MSRGRIEAMSVGELVQALDLAPHPEGGFYRETFRDSAAPGGRAASTAIYFLLPGGASSRWHRVDAAEVWHHYAGAALELMIEQDGARSVQLIGKDLAAGERPQGVVPAGAWQAARSRGEWTLVGCTVAPGFAFAHFEAIDGAPPRER